MTTDTTQLKKESVDIVKVMQRRQVVIPKEIFEKLGLGIGDYLEAKLVESRIVYIPKQLIDKDQSWFWTKEWQEGERRANENIKAGRIAGPFNTAAELLKDLKS
ncbi:AbrB/MazE/SpoVT family DNA-binding domain-containing protein [Patescibacteria group bacterium]|nr:AbrB/MazE/SpoVT family DNA-binding domain-containing protein [Patescibacteria group bacterium]